MTPHFETGATQEWLDQTQPIWPDFARQVFKARDGFTLSIQAGEYHYCWPRMNQGPYQSVELGFPNKPDEILREWAEGGGGGDITQEVFPTVPVEVVDMVLAAHDAAYRVMREEEPEVVVLVDALRAEGVIQSLEKNPNKWSTEERLILVHSVFLLDWA